MYSADRGRDSLSPNDRASEVLPLYVSDHHQIPRTPQSERQQDVPLRISDISWLISALDLINATITLDTFSVGNNNKLCRDSIFGVQAQKCTKQER